MRICMISSEYPPKWGGVGVVAYYLSTWMARRGHEVHVVTRDQKIGYKASHENIHVHPVKWLKAPMFFTTSFGRNAVKWYERSGIDFDIVHVHSNMALLSKKHYDGIRCPVVSTMHGTWWGERSTISFKDLSLSISALNDLSVMYLSPFFDRYEDLALERSNGVINISRSECRDLARRGIENRYGRRVLLANGIDTEEFHPDKKDPLSLRGLGIQEGNRTVVSVGRWAARKGIRELLRTFEIIHERRKDVSLILIGWGPLENEIRKWRERKGLKESVKLMVSPPFPEMQKVVASSDLALFHSYWEGFGLTFGEALSSGIPVVSTDVGAAADMIVEGTGKLVKVGDVKGQAEAALELLSRDDLEEWGRRGREHILEYCPWSKISEMTEAFYNWVIEDPENKGEWRREFMRSPV